MKDSEALTRLKALVARTGSQVAAAKHLRCSQPYVSDMLAGRRNFSAVMLEKLGLRRQLVESKR